MSLFGEFHVPSERLALHETLEAVPDVIVEIERVVATDELLTPYFWVSSGDADDFEAAAEHDPTIENLHRLDQFDAGTHYRAHWTENVETLVYAYTEVGAVILEATGTKTEWELRIRFDDRECLSQFQEYCDTQDISFELSRLYEISNPRTGAQFGLTRKQYDALTAAWEMGYFDTPRDVTQTEVAGELGITEQSLSQRLRRAYHTLIAHTLVFTSPTERGY